MEEVKISAVSYINTLPFIQGIKNSPILDKIDLSLGIPAECAKKLLSGEVDLGLVPVAVLPQLENYEIVSDFCIGANSPVRTVKLFSEVPIEEIDSIYLDYQSRTSVNLMKVLAKNYWKKDFEWKCTEPGFENNVVKGKFGAVLIGDRVFDIEDKYTYQYDLAEEWMKFTGLPFVFATWVCRKKLSLDFLYGFNEALKMGVQNIETCTGDYLNQDQIHYLKENISYPLDEKKKSGLNLFLKFLKELKEEEKTEK